MAPIDFAQFDALTFDCYGTLIDWETGILARLRRGLEPDGVQVEDDDLLERFARHEAAIEAGPYRPYREVLTEAARAIAGELGAEPTEDELAAFGASVGQWPAFADTPAALQRLHQRFRLGV